MNPQLKDKITNRECSACGSLELLELHHIVPKQYGGSDIIDNLQWLCKKCHMEKHSQGKVKKSSLYVPYDLWVKYKEYELMRLKKGSPTNFNNHLLELLFKQLNQNQGEE